MNAFSTLFHNVWDYDARANAEHDCRNVFLRSRRDIEGLLAVPLKEAAILVLGCGYAYPDVILFSEVAQRVVGLDVADAFYRDGFMGAYRAGRARRSAPMAALRAAVLSHRYRRYYTHFRRSADIMIDHRRYDVRSYDGLHMPFADGTFDAVISNAVLEHVSDLDQMVAEAHRVTKAAGVSYHHWHNYYSLTGGHLPVSSARAEPWGHVRGLHEVQSDLNRLKPEEIERSFARLFDVAGVYPADWKHRRKGIDPDFAYEGRELLTERFRRELSPYPDELLLTSAYLIIGRKPG